MINFFRFTLERNGITLADRTVEGTAELIRDRVRERDVKRLVLNAAKLLRARNGGTTVIHSWSNYGTPFQAWLTVPENTEENE